MVKGDSGRLNTVVSLFYEAIQLARKFPSQAPDAGVDPLRPAARLLTSFVNNTFKYMEFPVRLMLQYLTGAENFQCSDTYSYVFIGVALRNLIERTKKLKRPVPELADLEAEYRDELDDLDIGFDDHVASGEIGKDSNGKIRVPLQDDDYLHRTGGIRKYNFLEFGYLVRKRLKAVPINGDDQVDEEDERSTRGTSRNQSFDLSAGHTLAPSHELYLVDKPSVPILAGGKVPIRPGPRSENDRSWLKRANTFGAYFVALMDPWNDLGVTNFDLSWEGLMDLIASYDMNNNIDRCRYEYILNCAQVSAEDLTARKAQNILRNYSATTYAEYKKAQDDNRRRPGNGFEERATSDRHEFDEARAQEIIDCIRLNFEEAGMNSQNMNSTTEKQKNRDKRIMESLFQLLNGNTPLAVTSAVDPMPFTSSSSISQTLLRSSTTTIQDPKMIDAAFEKILSLIPAKKSQLLDEPAHPKEGDNQPSFTVAQVEPEIRLPDPKFQGDQLNMISAIVNARSDEETSYLLLGGPGTGKSATAGEAVSLLTPGSVLITATTGKVPIFIPIFLLIFPYCFK